MKEKRDRIYTCLYKPYFPKYREHTILLNKLKKKLMGGLRSTVLYLLEFSWNPKGTFLHIQLKI